MPTVSNKFAAIIPVLELIEQRVERDDERFRGVVSSFHGRSQELDYCKIKYSACKSVTALSRDTGVKFSSNTTIHYERIPYTNTRCKCVSAVSYSFACTRVHRRGPMNIRLIASLFHGFLKFTYLSSRYARVRRKISKGCDLTNDRYFSSMAQ